jgi:hypothetical protein
VEGSTSFKTKRKKKTVVTAGDGNVEAPAPNGTKTNSAEGIDRRLSSVARDERTKGGRGGNCWHRGKRKETTGKPKKSGVTRSHR